jgi:general secretion pathway protein H
MTHDGLFSRGYTLIELAAVIGIVLIISVAAFAAIQSVRKADISTSAGRMAASIRYLYDLAVLNNRPYRLVVDLADNSYWGELAEDGSGGCPNAGAAVLPGEVERKFGPGAEGAKPKPGQARPGAAGGTEEALAGLARGGGAVAEGEAAPRLDGQGEAPAASLLPKDNLLTKRTLPKGIVFSMVMTSHQDEPTEEGRGEIYFFPSGYVERAYIFLKRDDDVYTVETVPLKGKGLVHNVELDPRDLLDRT